MNQRGVLRVDRSAPGGHDLNHTMTTPRETGGNRRVARVDVAVIFSQGTCRCVPLHLGGVGVFSSRAWGPRGVENLPTFTKPFERRFRAISVSTLVTCRGARHVRR